ncbi:hypothetical protein SAMD00019534_092200 [Acytostelium subglobosum LB1]|uniref:hypothetical protein n=1 Tax=Acytostelium subglobosum LB1 TaxID=1410327 RepID=UPI000644CD89|nr:hypothetical protein SAMD00019534_092200 [Acytostelium subglobosum LB1]GAM26045.1 hypothetical protein SAMD00019534_092200 [Acytostelium subglobosum LB1]|eukprot:XP_012751088.1 hypothetical protein SAMD00019534_092200 [Acytostelium subglobosum LB1]
MSSANAAASTTSPEKKAKKVDGDYQEPEYITIEVTDPLRIEDYISYKITTRTTFPEYSEREFTVRRRYKEFSNLRDHLKQKLSEKPKAIKFGELYPLPGNNLSSLFGQGRFEAEFIEERRKALEQFLNSVANHNFFRFVNYLHRFLQDKDATFL